MALLNQNDALVLIVDIQEKLVNAVYDKKIVDVAAKMVSAAKIMGLPCIITEQYPKGLGETVSEVKSAADASYVEKTSFSAFSNIAEILEGTGRKQVILLGIEAHICVYQTAMDLLENGYDVNILADGVGSRREFELTTGLNLLEKAGAKISCLEIALFELLKSAKDPNFKAVQALIK